MNTNDARFHNVLGDDYDVTVVAYPHHDELQNTVGNKIKEFFKNSPEKELHVLEIGFGTGLTTKVLLDADPRIVVTALDNEPKMVEHLNVKLKKWNALGRVHVKQIDIIEYLKNAPDASFDAVSSVFTIHNFDPKLREVMHKDIYRVLKPGGIFVNGDKIAHDDPMLHEQAFKRQDARFAIYDVMNRPDMKKATTEHQERDNQPDLIFKENEATTLLNSVGFIDVKIFWRVDMEATIFGVKNSQN